MDRMTIIGKDGKAKYLVDEFDDVVDLTHTHQFEMIDGEKWCLSCHKSEQEIEGESNE